MQKFRQGLEIWGLQLRQGGASGFLANLLHSNTADRNYTFPDKTGTIALISDVNKTGFPNRTSTTLTWNTGTRTITLAPTGSNFTVSVNGTTYTKTSQSSTIPNVTGGYFIYFDNTGTLQQSTTPWDLLVTAPVAYVYWDATLGDGFAFEERHMDTWSPSQHYYEHNVNGTEAISGFAISGYDLAGGGGNATNAFNTYSIATGKVADEDIVLDTSVLADGGPYTIFNRTGATGTWTWTKANTIPFKVGTTFPQYNQWTGATWQLTEGASLRYINYFVYATTSLDPLFQYIIIPGQNIFTSLAGAQAETYANLSLGTMPFQEIVPLYQITLRTGAGVAYNGATGSCRIEAVTRITGSKTSISQAAITNHEGLAGLLGGDGIDGHYHLNLAQYTVLSTVNGGITATAASSFSGIVSITNATASTSSITGAEVITGGLGVGGAIYAGGALVAGSGGNSVYLDPTNGSIYANAMVNRSTLNNALMSVSATGPLISRNIADAGSALTINLVHASSTGKILDLQFGGVSKASVNYTGDAIFSNVTSPLFLAATAISTNLVGLLSTNSASSSLFVGKDSPGGDNYGYPNAGVIWSLSNAPLVFATNAIVRFTLDGSTGAAAFTNTLTATSLIKSGGTSSQFLKADGSVDSTTYLSSLSSSDITTALGYTPNKKQPLRWFYEAVLATTTIQPAYRIEQASTLVAIRTQSQTPGTGTLVISVNGTPIASYGTLTMSGSDSSTAFVDRYSGLSVSLAVGDVVTATCSASGTAAGVTVQLDIQDT